MHSILRQLFCRALFEEVEFATIFILCPNGRSVNAQSGTGNRRNRANARSRACSRSRAHSCPARPCSADTYPNSNACSHARAGTETRRGETCRPAAQTGYA